MIKKNILININLKSLKYNIQYIKKQINNKKIKFLLPVKADAYGHGIEEISKFVVKHKLVDFLGVATLFEAETILKQKIKIPIIILSDTLLKKENIQYIVKNELIQLASNLQLIRKINLEAKKQNKIINIHLMFDTGMGRCGFLYENFKKILIEVSKFKNIKISGIATHFAVADSLNQNDKKYTQEQIKKFEKIKSFAIKLFKNTIIFHASNSGGVLIHKYYADMVRIGKSSYGYTPNKKMKEKLRPVMSIETSINLIKKYQKNCYIGYEKTYKTKKTQNFIATIPVGYADGVQRNLSNKLDVLIKKKKYKIVGKISMDQMSILVNKNINIGDKVIILGQNLTA